MTPEEIIKLIKSGELDGVFSTLSGKDSIERQKERACGALAGFAETYGCEDENGNPRKVHLFSVGGRSEISGNHTDHNRGKVIAAAVDLNVFAAAAVRDDGKVQVKSEGYPMDTANVSECCEPCACEYFTSKALLQGTCAGFEKLGFCAGGFDAYTVSDVLKGSGLSSSAAFEVTLGKIMSFFYNGDAVPETELAKIAKFAENKYFGKPCGLMDQTACAVGGLVKIDFKDPDSPVVRKLSLDLDDAGYALCITDTGSSHADLNDDYAAVPKEMKAAAGYFGKEYLREVDEERFLSELPEMRGAVHDRAIMRAFHFFEENKRVDIQSEAIEKGELDAFFKNVSASGQSSFKFLQNVFSQRDFENQSVSLALMLSEKFLENKKGACRVHGGGFAGTIQAFVPAESAPEYKAQMESVFGTGSCHILNIRKAGAVTIC